MLLMDGKSGSVRVVRNAGSASLAVGAQHIVLAATMPFHRANLI
jgi:hypothetical protein